MERDIASRSIGKVTGSAPVFSTALNRLRAIFCYTENNPLILNKRSPWLSIFNIRAPFKTKTILMKYILLLLTCLFLTIYSFAAFPIHLKEAPAESSQTVVEKSKHSTFAKLEKLVPHPGPSGHGMAILSIVLGIVGIFYIHALFGILAILIGLASMRRHMFRRPLAVAGVVLGIIDLFLLL
jgi:hypothetical protein